MKLRSSFVVASSLVVQASVVVVEVSSFDASSSPRLTTDVADEKYGVNNVAFDNNGKAVLLLSFPSKRNRSCRWRRQDLHIMMSKNGHENINCRRRFLRDILLEILGASSLSAVDGGVKEAIGMPSSQTTFELGNDLTLQEAITRLKEGQDSLRYLLENYDEVVEHGGGDNVRRYLGTVGTTSGLYGISKVMKTLQSYNADASVGLMELIEEVNSALQSADGSAYATIFTVPSPTGEIPAKARIYFEDAKMEIKRALKSMNDIAEKVEIRK